YLFLFIVTDLPNRMKTLQYNFLLDYSDKEMEIYKQADVDSDLKLINGANLEWLLQAYLTLKQRNNLEVICSNKFIPGCINLIHSYDLIKLKGTAQDFIVCIKGEFPWRRWAHYHIVQNETEVRPNSSALTLWIQPGLTKRNAQRTGITTVA